MDDLKNYVFPSIKKIDGIPQIVVNGFDKIDEYILWFKGLKIPRAIPPIYRDFVIKFQRQFGGRTHDYIEIVHYSDDLCAFCVCHVIDGKKVLNASVDYSKIEGDQLFMSGTSPASSNYNRDWIENEIKAVISTVLAVQAFILYHKPDVIPVIYDSPPKHRKSNPTEPRKRDRTIKPQAVKRIYLTDIDKPSRNCQYRKITWTVRGHYRHLMRKDGTSYVVYIKPHSAKRGEKKFKSSKIIIKEQ